MRFVATAAKGAKLCRAFDMPYVIKSALGRDSLSKEFDPSLSILTRIGPLPLDVWLKVNPLLAFCACETPTIYPISLAGVLAHGSYPPRYGTN